MKFSFFCLILSFFFFNSCQIFGEKAFRWAGPTMGTSYHLTFFRPKTSTEKFAQIIKDVDALLKRFNQKMSTYEKESEISRFNDGRMPVLKVDSLWKRVLDLSFKVHKESQGHFDITVMPLVNFWGFGPKKLKDFPKTKESQDKMIQKKMKLIGMNQLNYDGKILSKKNPKVTIDLSAIAKGLAVDLVGELLEEMKVEDYLIEIGGEVRVRGSNQGNPWRVGIDTPKEGAAPGESFQKVFKLKGGPWAMATSGDYRNFKREKGRRISHTISPKSGWPIDHNLASVTVVTSSVALSDAWATALNVMGIKQGREFLKNHPHFSVLFITQKNENSFSLHEVGPFQFGHNN